jgi:starch phosphorylase
MDELLSGSDAGRRAIAYFSMEVALESAMGTYSGGLGVLAGDTLRAAADLGIRMVGVTLLHRKGYFRQALDASGKQTALPNAWMPHERVEALDPRVEVEIEGRPVVIRAWCYRVRGVGGFEVPVYLLDTDLPQNAAAGRALTDRLYGGDHRHRLAQEAILGYGGVLMLDALGLSEVETYHMNEGHSALITMALLERRLGDGTAPDDGDLEAVRGRCVFTTHTPVPAGHDQFPISLAAEVLGGPRASLLEASGCCLDHTLNMTQLALELSRYVNGVAMRHGEISRDMFPRYPIDSITNGVHATTWTSPPFQALFDRHLPGWRRQSAHLRYAVSLPLPEVRQAHDEARRRLCAEVEDRTGVRLDPGALTIGFARRATEYKQATLLFSDLDRLRRIARAGGGIQAVFAGKAHPNDEGGKRMIRGVFAAAAELGADLPVVYLQGYDMALARVLCAGVDLWLNTPQKPREASGTSGMKAALNGVPSLSTLDGWWIEGHVEGVTGWSIGDTWNDATDPEREADSLYAKLEHEILPVFHGDPERYDAIRRSAIALNGSFFNAERMVFQYAASAYGL